MKSRYFHLTIIRHGETEENRKKILQGHMNTVLSETGRLQAQETGQALANIQIDLLFSSDLLRTAETAEAILAGNGVDKTADTDWACKPALTVTVSRLLRERDFGVYTGWNVKRWRSEVDSRQTNSRSWIPQDGESLKQLAVRAQAAFDELCQLMEQRLPLPPKVGPSCPQPCPLSVTQTSLTSSVAQVFSCLLVSDHSDRPLYLGHAVIVSHSGLINQLLRYLRSLSSKYTSPPENQSDQARCIPNCSISQLSVVIGSRNQVTAINQHSLNSTTHLSVATSAVGDANASSSLTSSN